jgi:F-box and leucine-rich repeat protein 7
VPAWTPSRQPGAPPRMAQCAVKPLFDICLTLVSEYIDDVESLWGLPDAIKAGISEHCSHSCHSGVTLE